MDVQRINGYLRYPVPCPSCSQVRWLRSGDARKAERTGSVCFQCSQAQKAKLGYRAMANRYGEKWAVRHVQAYRLQNPSSLEVKMMRVLHEFDYLHGISLEYVREYRLETKASGRKQRVYLVDFMIVSGGQLVAAIEVNGAWAHQFHTKRDRRKMALLKRRGIPALVIEESDLHAGTAAAKVAAFLGLSEVQL